MMIWINPECRVLSRKSQRASSSTGDRGLDRAIRGLGPIFKVNLESIGVMFYKISGHGFTKDISEIMILF